MSRIGKQPVKIPGGVDLKVAGRMITVKGPKGQMEFEHPHMVTVAVKDGQAIVERENDKKDARARHGLVRSLVQNMVTGVTEGYTKKLEIHGVGYKAQVQGNKVVFSLGFSHPVEFAVPDGIKIEGDKKQVNLTISGIDKQLVGQVAADMRSLRPPDAYKGKGVRYSDERVRLKAGKAAK
jgi:large subunit ribosomal protein L6